MKEINLDEMVNVKVDINKIVVKPEEILIKLNFPTTEVFENYALEKGFEKNTKNFQQAIMDIGSKFITNNNVHIGHEIIKIGEKALYNLGIENFNCTVSLKPMKIDYLIKENLLIQINKEDDFVYAVVNTEAIHWIIKK